MESREQVVDEEIILHEYFCPINQAPKDYSSKTLHEAAKKGDLEVVRWLLSNGSSVGEKDKYGWTALLCAAEGGHLEVVCWLLSNGSSVGEKDKYGWTALLCAAEGEAT